MSISEAIILGFVQGATEFLPVSSSGHLIIAREFFNITDVGGLAFDAVLQLATALAIVVYFAKDLYALARGGFMGERTALIEIGLLAAATAPAVFLGVLLESSMEGALRSEQVVIGTLILGALIMLAGERFARVRGDGVLTMPRAVGIGFFQSLALIPGMSRSGMTITGGLFMGLTREAATRFAFLLGVPVILGSGLKKLLEILSGETVVGDMSALFVGALVAFVVGLSAIHFLIRYLRTHTLMVFVWYRLALASLLVILLVW